MNSPTRMFFAAHALLPEGWRSDVLLEWNDAGMLVAVTPDVRDAPADAVCAAGPVIPGMPNLHSHAFQRAMAGLTKYRANPTDSFWSWRDLMYRFAARITLGAIARWLYVEMLKAGYTSVCEFHYVHHAADDSRHANPAELSQRVVDEASETGIGMTVRYVGDNPMGPPLEGTITELRHTQAVVQDNITRRRWAVLYAAILFDATAAPIQNEAPPPRPRPEEFFIGDTVGFTDKHLNERVDTVVRLNSKTASIAVTDSEGHWRTSYSLLQKIVDI